MKAHVSLRLFALLLTLCLVFVGCDGAQELITGLVPNVSTGTTVEMSVGDKNVGYFTAEGATPTAKDIQLVSSDTDVATVSLEKITDNKIFFTLTAVGAGEATVTCQTADASVTSAAIKVSVTGGAVDNNDPPSGGGNDTPSGGGNDTPSGGGNDTPSGGGNDTPSGGGNDTPSGGGNDTPSGGVTLPDDPEVPALTTTFTPSVIPTYEVSKPYVDINGGVPYFTSAQYTVTSYEHYSARDTLGRCGAVVACIGRDIMPTEDRGNISSVHPTGWHSIPFGGSTLYSRAHLIAFQLTGENANWENLITGTVYMNQMMTLFENEVADYVKETGNHVLYRVTPVFTGNNLLADGVLMEAISIEDGGDGICFNVYLYNVQPGMILNYADGTATVDEDYEVETGVTNYVLNNRNKKFHFAYCANAESISAANKEHRTCTRDELIEDGYTPAGCCNP